MKNNGYAPSIMETENGQCFICRKMCDTARHELFYGTANRKLSKAEGLWIDVCPDCHAYLHRDKAEHSDILALAQQKWMDVNNTTEEAFIQLFGKSWL